MKSGIYNRAIMAQIAQEFRPVAYELGLLGASLQSSAKSVWQAGPGKLNLKDLAIASYGFVRTTGLQLCLYMMIAVSALGVSYQGASILFDIVNSTMSRMGAEAAEAFIPRSVEAASLRLEIK